MSDTSQPDITSPRNRWIKLARSLHRRRQRYRERAILVEGVRTVREALSSGIEVRAILTAAEQSTTSEIVEITESATQAGIHVLSVENRIFESATDTENPQGILAICSMPENARLDPSPTDQAPLILIVDQVRDPGNLGTLLRSALGSGVSAVFIGPGSVDPYSPKVLRSGAGAHFRLNIAPLRWDELPAQMKQCSIYAADADSDMDYVKIDWAQPSAIVIGNETAGISMDAFQRVHGRVGIPLANRLESLNAGVAGSVILFEAWRQRRTACK